MVQLTSITTRGGDAGKTSLGDGKRLSKHSLRIEAIGAVDELNSFIGVAQALCAENKSENNLSELAAELFTMQNDLFDLGADLCLPDQPHEALRITETQVNRMDQLVAKYNQHLNPLKSFVLPGGTLLAAQLHVCRSVVRRAERTIVALYQDETINPQVLCYINRLSDVFFVMARVANDNGQKDILWLPGKFQ